TAHLVEQLARDVALLGHTSPTARKGSALNFVVRVVDRLRPVLELAEASTHAQRPAGFDARDAALAQPDERDRFGAVEQFGLDPARASLRVGLDAAQGADHRDVLATVTVDGSLRAGVRGFVA